MPALRIIVTGTVQGVFFRAYTKENAKRLHLTGWVRNNKDGSVEIHAEGTENALKELESWCHRGPPGAQVEQVTLREVPDENRDSFEIME